MTTKNKKEEYGTLALLPLRDVVVYPHMVLPLFVGRAKSIAALDAAIEHDQPVFLLSQERVPAWREGGRPAARRGQRRTARRVQRGQDQGP